MRLLCLLVLLIAMSVFAMPADLRGLTLEDHARISSQFMETRLLTRDDTDGSLASNYTFGIDVSQLHSLDTLKCAVKDVGAKFFIPRGYRSSCTVDPNVVQNVKNGWAAGMSHVDVYVFPSPKCSKSAAEQIKALHNALQEGGVLSQVGMWWIDVEGGPEYWFTQKKDNQHFLESLLTACKDLNIHTGIYMSRTSYLEILGSGYTIPGNTPSYSYPLWYPRYQKPPNPSMAEWQTYGGFIKPSMKQYAGTTKICTHGSVDFSAY